MTTDDEMTTKQHSFRVWFDARTHRFEFFMDDAPVRPSHLDLTVVYEEDANGRLQLVRLDKTIGLSSDPLETAPYVLPSEDHADQTARIAAAIMERIGATDNAMGVHIAHSRAEADALVRYLRERWQTDGVQDRYAVGVQEGAQPGSWTVIAERT